MISLGRSLERLAFAGLGVINASFGLISGSFLLVGTGYVFGNVGFVFSDDNLVFGLLDFGQGLGVVEGVRILDSLNNFSFSSNFRNAHIIGGNFVERHF